MFGKRSDGWLVKHDDPIVGLTPYLMHMRCDAQVMLKLEVDYEKLARYIVKKGSEGYKISFMELFIAAYVRTIAELPEVNRFIANKRMYARKSISVSFAVLQNTSDGSIKENTVKTKFDPTDTIYDVAARVEKEIAYSRQEEAENKTMKVAKLLTKPVLANLVVGLARVLDRYGLLPKYIIEASPFHTGLFITNMASIGMPAVYHHIYNFGTTSTFVSIGKNERKIELDKENNPVRKRVMPIGIVADERVCAGMVYGQMIAKTTRYLNNPELLELPPESVVYDQGYKFTLPKVKIKKHRWRNLLRFYKGKKGKEEL